MLIGVVADTHDNMPKIASARSLFVQERVEAILHAGDFVAPFALKALTQPGIPLIGVFGNNDGERTGLRKLCDALYEPPHRLELGGRVIVLAHDPKGLENEPPEGVDLIVQGHTHWPSIEEGTPLAVNPGEAGGWLTGRCTVAIVDLAGMRAEIRDLGSQETVQL